MYGVIVNLTQADIHSKATKRSSSSFSSDIVPAMTFVSTSDK